MTAPDRTEPSGTPLIVGSDTVSAASEATQGPDPVADAPEAASVIVDGVSKVFNPGASNRVDALVDVDLTIPRGSSSR